MRNEISIPTPARPSPNGQPKLSALSEPPPQQAELIRKPRKPKPVEEETDEG